MSAEKSKILLDIDLKIISLDYQNNYVEIIMNSAVKNFNILTNLNLQQSYFYFDDRTKLLFSDLFSDPAKFLIFQ